MARLEQSRKPTEPLSFQVLKGTRVIPHLEAQVPPAQTEELLVFDHGVYIQLIFAVGV